MKIFAHFSTIKDNPWQFALWFITSIILSLSSFWIPSLLGYIIGENFYCQLMGNNPFIVFSIVFLSNSILYSINHIGGGSNTFAVAIRGIALVVSIMYLVFLSAIIPLKLINNIVLDYFTQYVLLLITILIGIYVYGFRDSKWEKSVDDIRQEEDNKIENIVSRANNIRTDNNDIEI